MILKQPPQAAPAAPAAQVTDDLRHARCDRMAWCAVVILLLVQWGLFRQFALREVVWSYPSDYDQLAYLEQSYQTYERILDHGLIHGLEEGMGLRFGHLRLNAAGATLHLQAAVLYLLLGPSRMSALTLNFLYFALLQCVMVATVQWLTGRWSAALLALGLLLTTSTAFYYAGGLFDFRLDFIAMCLFGICICLVIRSNLFADWRWSAVTGLALAALGTFRFVALAHLVAIAAAFLFFLAILWLAVHSDRSRRGKIERQMIGCAIAAAILLLIVAPVLWHHRQAIHDYYYVGHVSGTEKQIRAQAAGTTTTWASVKYYPTSLVWDHAGVHYFRLCGIVLAIVGAAAAARWALGNVSRRSDGFLADFDFPAATFFVVCCTLVPLAVLERDQAKSPVVANVAVVPLVWAMLLAAIALARGRRGFDWLGRWGLIAAAAVALWSAGGTQFGHYTRRTTMSLNRAGIERLLAMYDQMADECQAMGWATPAVATDCIAADYLAHKNLSVLAYERHGYVIDAGQSLGQLQEYPVPELFERLKRSDFVVLSGRTGPPPYFEYPFDRQMREMHPQLVEWCEQNMVALQSVHVFDRDVTLYMRPAVQLHAAADGWITSDGLIVTTLGRVLRSTPHVEMRGQADFRLLHGTPHVHAKLLEAGHEPVDVPTTITVTGGTDYVLKADVDPALVSEDGPVRIRLTFDEHFVPKQIGTSNDPRELVMQVPTSATLHR